MFCKNCGIKLNENDKFCKNCGTAIIQTNKKEPKIGWIIVIIILFIPITNMIFIYNYRINQKTATIKIPYANQTIQPNTKITKKMISYIDLPINFITGSYLKEINDINNKCSNYNTIIPKGSIFYSNFIEECNITNSNKIKNDINNFFNCIDSIKNYYEDSSIKQEKELEVLIDQMEKKYKILLQNKKYINKSNLNEEQLNNLTKIFNQSEILYNDIKNNRTENDKKKFEEDFNLLSTEVELLNL